MNINKILNGKITEVNKKINFLQEFNESQYNRIKKEIKKLFYDKTLVNHREEKKRILTYSQLEDFFGLPYTSSSSYAGLWNTNTIYYIDDENQYNIIGFSMDNENVYIIAWDKMKNEKIFKIV
jgi:hypothetical protein